MEAKSDTVRAELLSEMEPYPLGGIEEVMRRLGALALEGMTSERIRSLALKISTGVTPVPATGLPDRTRFNEIAAAVYRYVSDNVAYVHDPHGIESLESAEYTLRTAAGDCDAHTVLGMSLLGALGIPTRFVLVGQDPAHPKALTHIYLDYRGEDGRWYPFDTTLATHVGDAVPDSAVIVERVYELQDVADEETLQEMQGPIVLQTRRARLNGPALAGPADYAEGPVSGPHAWLQITEKREGEQFSMKVYASRGYTWFSNCDVLALVRSAESGEVLAYAYVPMSKFSGIQSCNGEAQLIFPRGFNPASRAVTIEVYDAGVTPEESAGAEPLGQSVELYLSEQAAEKRKGFFEGVGGLDPSTLNSAVWMIGGGALLFASWPYVKPVLSRLEEEGE